MNLRFGPVGKRVRPFQAHELSQLASDLPQHPAIQPLAKQLGGHFSVDTYRGVVESLSYETRYVP